MQTPARIILLLAALLCGGFVALLGGGFSRAVEPESYTVSTSIFWFLAGAVVASPLWLPAVIPRRYPVALKVCRRVSAVALLLPTYLFAGIVVHNLSRSISGLGATPSALVLGAVLTAACVVCLFLLLWPELSAPPNQSIKRTPSGKLRLPMVAAHIRH